MALHQASRYDMRAMLRYAQLWLSHSDNDEVNKHAAAALQVCSQWCLKPNTQRMVSLAICFVEGLTSCASHAS